MSIEITPTSAGAKALQDAVDGLIKGVRDPEVMRRAGERMDRMREELRQEIGIVDVAVDLVRDARDQ